MRKSKIIRSMTERIAETGVQVILTSPADIEAGARSGMVGYDMMEKFLRRSVLSPPSEEVAQAALLTIAMMCAVERTEQQCVTCDEDQWELNEYMYSIRYTVYIRQIKVIADYSSPAVLAEFSYYGITGMGIPGAQSGALLPVIKDSWRYIQLASKPFGEVQL